MTLEQTQNIIADDSFVYMGNSLEIIDIVNAIKDGYRLYKPSEIIDAIKELESELSELRRARMDNITFEDVKKRAMSEGEEARLQLAYVMGERAGMIKAQSIYAKYLGNLTETPEMKCEED